MDENRDSPTSVTMDKLHLIGLLIMAAYGNSGAAGLSIKALYQVMMATSSMRACGSISGDPDSVLLKT